MNKIKAIVVDDELASRNLISELIPKLNPFYEVLAQTEDILNAYELINHLKPDVLFLDIRMPGGGGFELLAMFQEINFEVVFISGFDSYALKAFEFNALDYVLKPVDSGKFEKTLKKIEQSIERKTFRSEDMKNLLQSYDLDNLVIAKIPIHTANKVFLVPVLDILYLTWLDGFSQIKTISNEKYNSSKQLSDFEFILEQHPFIVRINKGTFINLNHIKSYSKGISCIITLMDDSVLEVSRRKKTEILDILSQQKIKS
jgi:two-component system, LytTR family, response regulator